MSTKVFANHAHVFPESINPGGTLDRLTRMLDACQIDGAVCFAPFPKQVVGTDIDPNPWLARELKQRPRLVGFGTINMDRPDVRAQVKQAHDLGLKGLKLHPNVQEFDLLDARAFETYAAAQELGLFVTFHSGVHHYRLKHYQVMHFDEIAHHFPELRFSMEHVGGYSFFNQALAVIVNNIPFPPVPGKRCMVFGGLTSCFTPHFLRFWYMDRTRMLELVAQAGASQLIFGLDFPYNLEENTQMALATLRDLGLCEAELGLILGGNIKRELGLPG